MKINILQILIWILCLNTTVSFSQNQSKKQDKKVLKANTAYEKFSFVEAGKLYEEIVKKGNQSAEIYGRLGDTYFFNADYTSALKWYKIMIENSLYNPPQYYHRYSICLRANGFYKEGFDVMNNFYDKMGKNEEKKNWNSETFFSNIEKQSNRYNGFGDAGINSPFSDFGAVLIPNQEAIKMAFEIAKWEKKEKERIIKETVEKRRNQDNTKFGTKGELINKGINKKNTKPGENSQRQDSIQNKVNSKEVFLKLPKYSDVIYATAKDSGIFKRRHSWNEKPFLKLYTAQIDEEGNLFNETKLTGEINSKFHQSTPVLTKDGLTMYFTSLVTADETKNKKTQNAASYLKIFKAQKVNNKWVNIHQLPSPINLPGSSSAHPALSPDNDELYFVSNRKNTINDTDLYVIERKKGGGFAFTAQKMDDEINTYGRETFPFVDNAGILYFSSDGHPGLGGLDVFAAAKDDQGKYTVVNLGEPVNSTSDDFAYIIDSDSKKGFLSSNRKEGKGDDDIYKFLETKSVVFPFKLEPVYFGTVKDSVSGEALPEVEIAIYNELNEKIKTLVSDQYGKYSIDLPMFKSYSFEFNKKGFAIKRVFVESLRISEKKEIPVTLFNELSVIVDDKVVTLTEGDDLTSKLKLGPIYFDYGGYTIRKSSKLKLDKIITLMKIRPSISIEVRSHTDSRGKDDYNMRLSKNRAKTTMDYIVLEGGISRDRIFSDGYGETQLINNCSNNVECSEKEHELNRRSEFIIVIKK